MELSDIGRAAGIAAMAMVMTILGALMTGGVYLWVVLAIGLLVFGGALVCFAVSDKRAERQSSPSVSPESSATSASSSR